MNDITLKNRVISTKDPYDSVFLDNAISTRNYVNAICNVTIPTNYYPLYVGNFKNGKFHGEGVLIHTQSYQNAYTGYFKNGNLITLVDDLFFEDIGSI
ncbi:MAG: hypothetical protein AB4372_10575 [Xenococcus sp. (in: cyanobacteria)]